VLMLSLSVSVLVSISPCVVNLVSPFCISYSITTSSLAVCYLGNPALVLIVISADPSVLCLIFIFNHVLSKRRLS